MGARITDTDWFDETATDPAPGMRATVGTEITFIDETYNKQKYTGAVVTSDSNYSTMECFGTRQHGVDSDQVIELVAGSMNFSAGAYTWSDNAQTSTTFSSGKPASLYTFTVVEGAASLAAAA